MSNDYRDLLQKSKEVHMQATMIFTSNDIIVNLGVIAAAALVYVTIHDTLICVDMV